MSPNSLQIKLDKCILLNKKQKFAVHENNIKICIILLQSCTFSL